MIFGIIITRKAVICMKRKDYDKLLYWKNHNNKMPYMLIGARQTGKTYLLNEFCNNEFENYIYINLDKEEQIKEIFEQTLDSEKIIEGIELITVKKINVDNTVIFFDEIQVSERAICSLKYFCESPKEYKIVTAGSLLGVKINRFKSSFPVGKVWIDYLYPMDFEEFLYAINEEKLVSTIKKSYEEMSPMLEPVHEKALKLYNEYICIGGMPVAILNYIENDRKILNFNDDVLNMIIISYLADMSKYTDNTESLRNNRIYNSIPMQLGKDNKKFKFSLVEKSARAREYDSSMDWLLSSNMLLKCQSVLTPKSPLKAYSENSYKIYLNDIGLLRVLAKISKEEILSGKNMLYKGVFTENYVAEVLYAKYNELFYWSVANEYEVDFLININGDIIPVEVKASDNVSSKSLNNYIKRFKPAYAIRLSTKNFGEANGIRSIPLYASFLI